MKVVILAGGYGTRLSEETDIRPKPMVEIGGMPILWHIMKIYSCYGFNEFVILLGYKGYMIKEYFTNYLLHQSDVTIDLSTNRIKIHNNACENWTVTLLDTGRDTLTGGRILRAKRFVENETFMLTYGDGIADVNINNLLQFHKLQGKIVTMTAVQPEGRFGTLDINGNNTVSSFVEKPTGDNAWINGGFLVCEPKVFDFLKNADKTSFEGESLSGLAGIGELAAYKHSGFWKCMDTLRDRNVLNELWESGHAKWKTW